mgnify:CR=1 FL=1|tara:strand:- start:385 stop:600 length:216 start_codon:yes stop_codon:yes gene_type:complete
MKGARMSSKFIYKILDYVNIEHHNNSEVELNLNDNYGSQGYELLSVLDMGENNSNKDGKSSRFRYIFKKNV